MARRSVGAAASGLSDLPTIADLQRIIARTAYKSGSIYYPSRGRAIATTSGWSTGTARAAAFAIEGGITISGLAAATVAASSGCNLSVYLYAADQYGQITGNFVASATIAFTASNQGAVGQLSANVFLPAGLYWAICNCDTGSVSFSGYGNDLFHMYAIGSTTLNNLRGGQLTYTMTQLYLTAPGASPALTEANAVYCPLIGLKAA